MDGCSMPSRLREKTILKILTLVSIAITLILAFSMFQKGRSLFQVFSASTLSFVFCLTTSMRFIEGMRDVTSDKNVVRRKFIVRAIIMYLVTPVVIGVTFLIVPPQSAWSVAMLAIASGLALSAIVR